ncbi:MAG: glycosyltransferase, partial [Gemmatimonadales bacterium]
RARLPVVATAVAGVPESVTDGETGFLVPRGDAATLRDRIKRLLLDPELRRRQGENGRSEFERRFTLDIFVDKTVAVYQDILAECSGVQRAPLGAERARAAWPAP